MIWNNLAKGEIKYTGNWQFIDPIIAANDQLARNTRIKKENINDQCITIMPRF